MMRIIRSGLMNRIGPHRWDSHVLIAFLAFALVSLGMIALASEVAEGDTFAIDKMILTGLRHSDQAGLPIGPAWLSVAVADLTSLGSAAVLVLITVFALGYLLVVDKKSNAMFVAASITGGALLSGLLKAILVRPRPEIVPHLVDVSSSSFPSGHSMNSAIVYLTLAVLLARSEEDRHVQVYLIAVALTLTLIVGSTRVYLGVHWPSDVLAGWAVGAIWAAGCSLIARELQRRGAIERPVEGPVDGHSGN
ncbi:phosphatase PAP2 family protein [Aurantiacibacter rhizosphaerae]|uniref:Phosphatase PAP2 family protein n=1 Tax=Aurantiacibacter rhizosphaerae TaxID=2691582 RepID=A0A844XBG9_9SPHN|nr:phosphatase PAP2 family protein [Aurantiacibacter rhizosphaerae]MWV27129.1 phosphatase PAP2 family protein [Aurantiacibacter rhizosphaerae]